jgi:hypothetical protein
VESFNSKFEDYQNECGKLVIDIKQFQNSSSKYMDEFRIDEKIVEEALVNTIDFISKLNQKNHLFEKLKFNQRAIQFRNSSFKLEADIFGRLSKFMFDEFSLTEYNENNDCLLLEHDSNGQTVVFYTNDKFYLNIDLIDSKGKSVKSFKNLLKTSNFAVAKSSKNYILNPILTKGTDSIFGHPITTQEEDLDILILVDNQFNYLKHTFIDYNSTDLACNELNILCIDDKRHFHFYDMDLKFVANHQFDIQQITVQDAFAMNDNHLFILCTTTQELSIFDLKTYVLVKKIDSKALRIKLVSNSYFILFQLEDKVVHLYNQSGVFEKLDEIKFDYDDLHFLNNDNSSSILFYGDLFAKSITFNDLFNIPFRSKRA